VDSSGLRTKADPTLAATVFGVVVRIEHDLTHSPAGLLQRSHNPANANTSPLSTSKQYACLILPSLGEFRAILEKEFDCKYKKLDGVLVDPDGKEHEVYYFERKIGKKTLFVPADVPDDNVLTPSVLRSLCSRLQISLDRFGFILG